MSRRIGAQNIISVEVQRISTSNHDNPKFFSCKNWSILIKNLIQVPIKSVVMYLYSTSLEYFKLKNQALNIVFIIFVWLSWMMLTRQRAVKFFGSAGKNGKRAVQMILSPESVR